MTTRLCTAAFLAATLATHAALAAESPDPEVAQVDASADASTRVPRGITRPDQSSGEVGARSGASARRGVLAPGGLVLPAAEALAINLVMMEWNRTIGAAPWSDVNAASIGRNLRSAWVLDGDDFWVNQFAHPYQGTWSFTAARSSGLGFWGSVPFTFGASLLWEVTGETTPPSVNDQVTTTVAGVVIGEILYRFAGALRAEGGPWRVAAATVLAPMGAINRELVGTSQAHPAPPSRWEADLGAASFTGPSSSGGRAPVAYGGFSFTYGVPGAGLEIERPFDHFVLDVDWTAAADPAATVRARGLAAGETFDADLARGVYGAFLSFDFETPPGHRVSTAAVGFGSSARKEVGGGFALEGDAIASAVLLGAGGTVARAPDGSARDYRFGPGEQASLALRVLAGSRATAEVSLRQYLLFGAGEDPGTELLLQGSARATVRLVGAQGLGVEVSRYVRRADVAGEAVQRTDSAVRVYLVIGGGA